MKEFISNAWKGRAQFKWLMEIYMKAISIMECFKGRDLSSGKLESNTLVHSIKISCRGRGNFYGQMEAHIRVKYVMAIGLEKANSSTLHKSIVIREVGRKG